MQRIFIAGGSFVTTDAVARSLLRYAEALARGRDADVVRVPVVTSGGVRTADVLLGSGVAVFAIAEPADDADDESLGAEAVGVLEGRTRRAAPVRPEVADPRDAGPDVDPMDS